MPTGEGWLKADCGCAEGALEGRGEDLTDSFVVSEGCGESCALGFAEFGQSWVGLGCVVAWNVVEALECISNLPLGCCEGVGGT